MNQPFLPELSTAEIAFAETPLGVALRSQTLGGGAAVVAVAPPATLRQRRLDVTARRRPTGVDVDLEAVRENLRARLFGVISSLAWRNGDKFPVMDWPPDSPEFTQPVRAGLIRQLGIDPHFVDSVDRCKTLDALARDFAEWVRDFDHDGGLYFEKSPTGVLAIVSPSQLTPP